MVLFKENLKIVIRITHFLLLPLALVLFFPEVALSKNVYVSGGSTNIRSGPGLENSVIEVVKMDQLLKILKEEKEWLKVLLPSGKEGWIFRKTVKAEKPKSVIIVEHKNTIDHQRSQIEELKKNIEELKKNVAETIKKKEKLSFELQEFKLSQDQLIKDKEKSDNSRKIFLITGWIIACLIGLILGFLAGQFRLFMENKRFAKMVEVAKDPKYQGKFS